MRLTRWLIIALGILAIAIPALVSVVVIAGGSPVQRAVILMADGLILLWIVIGGLAMWLGRDCVRSAVRAAPGHWAVKFMLFAAAMALLEEAVTTTMTNCAPVFGVKAGQAYITASANYLDVVCCHSVVLFVPMFAGWAWVLSRWDFRPAEVFLLFGLTGTLAESGTFGPSNLINIGFWSYVYGLMVFLPAYSLPDLPHPRPRPRWYQYVVALLLPFIAVIPAAGVIHLLHPIKIHFPPMQ